MAGFISHPADTTTRWALMNTLPANRMTYRRSLEGVVMLYADPVFCGCVYMGNWPAYLAYITLISLKSHLPSAIPADMEAERRQAPAWDWGAWRLTADPSYVDTHREY